MTSGLLRSMPRLPSDESVSSLRTQPATVESPSILRLRRFSQCSRRVCFALCDNYCERVFIAWQDCSAYVGDEEANRRTRNAVERGNWLHGVLEDLWNGEDIQCHLDSHPAYLPYFESVMGFLETVDSPLLIESAIAWYDPAQEIGYSGTFDMLAKMHNGELALLDWKTSYKEKPDTQLADYRMQLGAYVQALEQMYDIEINEAHCAIAIHDPDTGHSQEAQIVSLSAGELAMQGGIMVQKVQQFFFEHYPGGRPLTISMDRGA
jgi:hypothetical protein